MIWRHAVPNAIVPAIQVTALQLAWMAGGIVLVEYVFQYPGIGAALVDAVAQPGHAGRPERDDARGRALRVPQPRRGPRDDHGHPAAEDGGTMTTDQTVDTAVDLGLEGAIEGSAPTHEELRGHQWLWIMRRSLAAHAHAHRARDRGPHGRHRALRPVRRAALADRVRRRAERRRRRRTRCSAPTRSGATSSAAGCTAGSPSCGCRPRRRSSASSSAPPSGSSRPTAATGSTTC